ncbi:hypothetical protein IFM61606_08972 [Aspergillus udagawae]|uniref:Glutathione synthase n=1 Tax=Aspergillus udagawae TaxID=91492 RepID=A0ABQ1B5B3_9EURO|nr:hypothetical protein IFM61606_08972 [Aspergillus udagawae]GFF94049.1 hypothetical protein IFM53868_07406 [Aspergillus udagawae]GFG16053.1 hypothetical protein IFM5058_07764 [Aspergillus udagawae]
MSSNDPLLRMPQICLEASRKAGIPSAATSASYEDRKRSEDVFCSALVRYLGGEHVLPYSLKYMCPHPVVVSNRFMASLKEFHAALSAALTNIVQRWVVDEKAALPSRMPLERHEEDLLRWIHKITEDKLFPIYDGHQGNWRPDFLLPANEADGFKVCEINSRFPSNGLDLNARMYKALDNSETKPLDLDVAGDPEHLMARLKALFHPEWPLRFVHNRENNPLIEALMRDLVDMKPRLLTPDDLHLVADETSPTGYKLQCVRESATSADNQAGNMEDIHQIALRLFLSEFALLSPQMQRQLAFNSNNDIRSIFLIHDKRILGILHQELDDLVAKHHVLTQRQADLLRKRVVFTIIPGSKELEQLTDSYYQGNVSKNDFILKPIRSGRGQGIILGQELSTFEWEAILADMKNAALTPDRTVYIIQPFVEQAEGDMFLDEEIGVQRTRRVGTYYSMHGEFVSLGLWRVGLSTNRTTNMTTGDAWKMGSMVTKMN